MSTIIYTRHARAKFEILKRHGFVVISDQVDATVNQPDDIIAQTGGRFIAQNITERHVVRVIYREEEDNRVVITFYPGRRDRFESQL